MRPAAFWIALLTLVAAPAPLYAQSDADRLAIEKAVADYVAAFNARDAERLAALWSEAGVYVAGGDRLVGRDAIRSDHAALFAEPEPGTLSVATGSIEFISPNAALERGTALVQRPDESARETRYRVVYVRQGGAWLIDRVSEDDVVPVASHYEKLKPLEWLIGEWLDDGGDFTVATECRWTANQNYISRTYKVTTPEGVESSGLQVIGWDAKTDQIRSWLFDSSGGFISGVWSPSGDRWTVQSVATLADGGSGSFVSVFRPLGDGRYAWQKINRVLDGRLLPNLDEVIIRRR